MANPRTPIPELEFYNSPNLKRALKRPPEPQLQKRAELEAMFADIAKRREEALAYVKEHGMILRQDKFTARGELYLIKVVNPALKIAQQCENQLARIAALLSRGHEPDEKAPRSTADLLAECEALLSKGSVQ
jgi:hypothetical protein